MKFYKIFNVLILLLFMVFVVSCGGDGGSDKNDSDTASDIETDSEKDGSVEKKADEDAAIDEDLQCQDDEHLEEGECLSNTKTVHCRDNAPANAASVITEVEINWAEEAWETPEECDWRCDSEFHLEEGVCESNTKMAVLYVAVTSSTISDEL